MASNLRAKGISGHVTDGAGNVIRNSDITIKLITPTSEVLVDTVTTNDDGYFTSTPLPNGIYAIFESGVMISTVIHTPDSNSIPVYKSSDKNVKTTDFRVLLENDSVQSFRVYIQIEDSSVNIKRFGSTYPIYDVDISSNVDDWFGNFSTFHSLNTDSRITTTRFDIEYYSPITETSNTYKRIRWAGVPAIKYSAESRLVIPLDYYSIVPTHPKYSTDNVNCNNDSNYTVISNFNVGYITVGDIICVSDDSNEWFGIVVNIDYANATVKLEEWKSIINTGNCIEGTGKSIRVYDGMFNELLAIDESMNEKITVVENVSAQDNVEELYSY